MRASFLWITDPWETLDHPRDTTLRLAEEALLLGARCHWCDVRSIRMDRRRILLDAKEIRSIGPAREERSIRLGPLRAFAPAAFSSLHYRTDPPVDLAYQHPLQILRLAGVEDRIVNPPSALLMANEKLEAFLLAGLMPPTLVSAELAKLEAFGRAEGRVVLKPLHTAQSNGVERLDWRGKAGAARARRLLALATDRFARPVLLQRYLKGIAQGETRLWFLDGRCIAAARKLPLARDFRVNIDRGSRLEAHAPTAHYRARDRGQGRAASAQARRAAGGRGPDRGVCHGLQPDEPRADRPDGAGHGPKVWRG